MNVYEKELKSVLNQLEKMDEEKRNKAFKDLEKYREYLDNCASNGKAKIVLKKV